MALATLAACFAAIPGFLPRITISRQSTHTNTNIIGSNHIETRRCELNPYVLQAVELAVGNLIITSTEQDQYVEITADDNLFDRLTPNVDGQRLILTTQKGISVSTKNPISYHLHIPYTKLDELVIHGAGSIQVDRLKTEKLNCDISGSGSIQVDQLETKKLNCDISGVGTINIKSGRTTDQTVKISGSGDYNASNFQTENSFINISGSGNVFVHVNQLLDVKISGSGSCSYSGTPPQIEKKISGSGSVSKAS